MKSNKKILFIGAPGSGKGTISKILVEKYKLVHISTGDLFRKKISEDSQFGAQIQNYLSSGSYVPDEITNKLVADFIKKIPKNQGYILDGYPRTLQQLEFMIKNGINLDCVFYLKIKNETIISRLSQRLFCQKCQKSYNLLLAKPKNELKCDLDNTDLITRNDDRPEIITHRIEKFNNSVIPIVEFFKKSGIIYYLDAEQTLEETVIEIEKWL